MLRILMNTVLNSPIAFERAWGRDEETARATRTDLGAFVLRSESFEDGGVIPERLAGPEGVSPQLNWANAPEEISRLIIIMDDPDAEPVVGHTFVHWVAAVPPYWNSIEEGASSGGWSRKPTALSGEATSTAYRGPKPPSGTHRYHIAIYAMSGAFDDPEFEDLMGSAVDDTKTCAREHFEALFHRDIVAKAEITGTYSARHEH